MAADRRIVRRRREGGRVLSAVRHAVRIRLGAGGLAPPFSGAIFVALHGSAYSSRPWQGAGIVYAPTDPTTHAPTQDWQTFLGGFSPDPDNVLHRPADIAFSPDGRMFFADDTSGTIFWMAPTTLTVAGREQIEPPASRGAIYGAWQPMRVVPIATSSIHSSSGPVDV